MPPNRLLDRRITLALIEPNVEIVTTEPAYLHAVGKWVRAEARSLCRLLSSCGGFLFALSL